MSCPVQIKDKNFFYKVLLTVIIYPKINMLENMRHSKSLAQTIIFSHSIQKLFILFRNY